MIPEEFVTFETAKLLKKAGFPQYEKNGIGVGLTCDHGKLGDYLRTKYDGDDTLAAPTQAQAMRWLREEKNLTILFEMISPSEAKDYGLNAGSYTVDIYDTCGLHLFGIDDLQTSPTYEAAAEAGIQAACKYLIEKGGEE